MSFAGMGADPNSLGEIHPNSVSARGCATATAPPDRIFITLFVSGDGILTEDAAKNADAKSNEIRSALGKAFPQLTGIDFTRVKIGEKVSRAYREEAQPPRPEVVNRLTLMLNGDSADDVPKMVDAALRAGAVFQLVSHAQYAGDLGSVVRYGLSDPAELEAQARSKALADAKQKALELARLTGRTLGELISVNYESGNIYDFNPARRLVGKSPLKYVSFANEPVEITAALRVTFGLKS